MSHFACSNFRSVPTRRDAIEVGGLVLPGFAIPYAIDGHATNFAALAFLIGGNAIPEVFA